MGIISAECRGVVARADTLKHTNAKFANKFFSARMIIDTGARHRSSQNPDHDDGSGANFGPTDVGNVA